MSGCTKKLRYSIESNGTSLILVLRQNVCIVNCFRSSNTGVFVFGHDEMLLYYCFSTLSHELGCPGFATLTPVQLRERNGLYWWMMIK